MIPYNGSPDQGKRSDARPGKAAFGNSLSARHGAALTAPRRPGRRLLRWCSSGCPRKW
jgi:hypothetical protein